MNTQKIDSKRGSTLFCPVAKQPGVPGGKHALQTQLSKNQNNQESTE